jgi:trans-2,3-dihydro-3-hydroxyanthranilate isomerase
MTLLPASTLAYEVVDVFALADGTGVRPYTGNPLAVVLGADELTTAQCQTLATEFNLSETVFPMASERADYRARIFTPGAELPFAGHPSIGAAWTLAALGTVAPGHRTQECAAGLVDVQIAEHGGEVRLTGPLPGTMRPTDASALLRAVGLEADDLRLVSDSAGPRIGGSGIPFAFLPVRPGALRRCRPDPAALAALAASAPDLTGVLAFELLPGLHVNARMFAAGELTAGITEDPATGSAALGLGGWLAAAGVVRDDGTHAYAIDQGVDMGRPSLLRADVMLSAGAVTRVRVSGQVAPIASGRIRVP